MSFKDLGREHPQRRVETPEDVELRARAAARHKAKEQRAEERRAGKKEPHESGAPKGEPPE